MEMQQYDPKHAISYLNLVSEFLKRYKEFHSPLDIVKRLGADCLKDITDVPEIQLMDACIPLPEGFDQRAYQFKELTNRRGMFDAAFHKGNLVNFRAQMFFEGWFAKMKVAKFITFKLRPLISDIVGVDNFRHDISTDTFYSDGLNGLIVAFRKVRGTSSVSTTITDKTYA